ncbi:MAG: esterase family protein [Rhizobiaceae bacterium]|nr:esterase family protein [Rhizobiaceae bacterium]
MQVSYHKHASRHLGRDMETKRYGHAGRPLVLWPTSNGRFFQYEDTGTIAAIQALIDRGEVQVFTLDGIDWETFTNRGGDPAARIARHEAFFAYIREEALPAMQAAARASNGGAELKPIFGGCSMGAFHSSNFVFRFPELAAGCIALSGVYSAADFFQGSLEGQIYFNSPIHYLGGMTDEQMLSRIRALRLIFCVGRGAHEAPMIADTRELEDVLRARGIPAWIDIWGEDVSHDWPWWHRQLPYFLKHWLDADRAQAVA